MYTLNLSPQVAEAINLTASEMEVLNNVRERASNYLDANPNANCNPQVKAYIEKYASEQAKTQRDLANFTKSLR